MIALGTARPLDNNNSFQICKTVFDYDLKSSIDHSFLEILPALGLGPYLRLWTVKTFTGCIMSLELSVQSARS